MDWRAWIGMIVFAVVLLGFLMTSARSTVHNDGPSIVMNSTLLDFDLPSTLPHPDAAAATNRLQAAAEQQHRACNEIEVYKATDPTVVILLWRTPRLSGITCATATKRTVP